MGEKSPSEGGGNEAARSARLRKEREQAEAIRKAEAKKPMRNTGMSDRQMIAQSDRTPNLSRANRAAAARTAGMAANRAAIEELTARRDDTRNPITRMNLDNQIKQLKQGGVPVQTTFGPGPRQGEALTVGVVRDGRYSGRQGFEPSRGGVRLDPMKGAYTTRYGTRGGVASPAVGGDSRPTTPAAEPTETVIAPTPQPTSADASDAIRRAQLSGGGGGGRRRTYIG